MKRPSKEKLTNIRTDLIKDKLKQSRIISAEVEYKKKIIQLINNFTANDYGEFLLDNATKDFLFIRPSGNPIDALGFIEMRTSGDLSCDGYTDVKKIRKLEFLSDDVAMCVFTLRSSFVYKDIQNSDLATVTAILKKINNQWKLSWMHRSSGDSDLSLWDKYL